MEFLREAEKFPPGLGTAVVLQCKANGIGNPESWWEVPEMLLLRKLEETWDGQRHTG